MAVVVVETIVGTKLFEVVFEYVAVQELLVSTYSGLKQLQPGASVYT